MRLLPEIEQGLERLYEAAKSHPIGRSQWLYEDGVKVYLRVSKRPLCGSCGYGVTIATVDVDEGLQRQGRFKALLKLCDEFVKHHNLGFVYVESVCNEHLLDYLLTQGFVPRYDHILGGDFYRLLSKGTIHDAGSP